jgi:RNA 3'-terminal phosphate cyclase (ATP)
MSMNDSWIEIDGAQGEGGGQMLRTSLTLSLLTGKRFRMKHVRANRPKPGLQPQHLMCLRAAAQIGQAKVYGDVKGSSTFTFEPGEIVAGKYHFAIGTAGSTSLVLQTIALPLALRGKDSSEVVITGGTHVKASPCYHFLEATWRAYLELFGINLQLKMRRPGFYPRGGGVLEARITPAETVQAWTTKDNQSPLQVTGFSAVAGLPESIAERQQRRALTRLRQARLDSNLELTTWEGGPGTVLALILHGPPVPTLFFGLGERGKPAERVADEAVDALLAHVEADPTAVDSHSADQIILALALASGPSSFRASSVTQHLLTNVAVIREFVEREMAVDGELEQAGRIRIWAAG